MAETTQPIELMKRRKPEGFEQQHIDKIDTITFEGYRVHFFTSLTHYTFVLIGQRDSNAPNTVFSLIYQALCEHCLKDPNYTLNQPINSQMFKGAIEKMFNTI